MLFSTVLNSEVTSVSGLPCPWDSPGKNTGVGSHSLLQGIFLTQGSNLCLLHCRQILYHLSHTEALLLVDLILIYFFIEHIVWVWDRTLKTFT